MPTAVAETRVKSTWIMGCWQVTGEEGMVRDSFFLGLRSVAPYLTHSRGSINAH